MTTANAVRFVLFFLLVGLTPPDGSAIASQTCAVCFHEYDSGLGSLPSAQGWIHNSNGLLESNYSVVSGNLEQGLTTPSPNVQDYQSDNCAFDFLIHPVTATADLKIISSTITPDYRTGWDIYVVDSNGLGVLLFVGESEVFLLGSETLTSGSFAIDTTDGFHLYELFISSAGASLSIDNVDTGLFLPISDFYISRPNTNRMSIGDGTIVEQSSSQLRGFSLCVDETVPVNDVSWGSIKTLYTEE